MSSTEQKVAIGVAGAVIAEPLLALAGAPGGVGFLAAAFLGGTMALSVDNIEAWIGKELPSLPLPVPTSEPGQPSLFYRMVNGKSVRGTAPDTTKETVEAKGVDQQPPAYISQSLRVSQDLAKIRKDIVPPGRRSVELKPDMASVTIQKKNIIPPGGYKPLDKAVSQEELSLDPRFPVPTDMARIIEKGFTPNRNGILLMETTKGHATEKMSELGHIGLAGSTGAGKTNVNRLVTSQLLACNAKVYMINPNYAPVKLNGNRLEDWRPIDARLQAPVAREATEITALLNHFMKIFKDRQEREQRTPKRGPDIFLVIGEWPVVVEECPEAVQKISRFLRQARQYGIHVLAEYQDAQIKTIGGNSGTRANYGTVLFAGGDSTTAKALLRPPEGVRFDFTGLGKNGAVYLRSHSHHAIPGRVPFFSNKALYMLLGFPEDPVTDELVSEDEFYEEDEEDIDAVFARMPDIRDEDGDIEEDEDYPFSPNRDNQRQVETPHYSDDVKVGVDLTTKLDVTISREQYSMLLNMHRNSLLKGFRQIMKIMPMLSEQHARNLNGMLLKECGETVRESEGE